MPYIQHGARVIGLARPLPLKGTLPFDSFGYRNVGQKTSPASTRRLPPSPKTHRASVFRDSAFTFFLGDRYFFASHREKNTGRHARIGVFNIFNAI